jgi:ABC-type nickel/cobalt efflux system permease component RcnA
VSLLIVTAAWLALFHTVIGVDHYIPFVALSKANNWPLRKTLFIVFLCGIGHVLGSIVLGFLGIALGSAVTALTNIESWRGELAVWFLIVFGLVYMLIGIRSAYKDKPHKHFALNGEFIEHTHSEVEHIHEHGGHVHFHRIHGEHKHKSEHSDTSTQTHDPKFRNTFWWLMVLFVLGPCEPLIPILMYPAAESDLMSLIGVTVVFSVVTIGTMMIMTFVALKGLSLFPLKRLDRYSHALAGLAIMLCGLAILVFEI